MQCYMVDVCADGVKYVAGSLKTKVQFVIQV